MADLQTLRSSNLDWHCSIVVKNIPPGVSKDQLVIHFQRRRNGGDDIKCIVYPYQDHGIALITYEDEHIIDSVIQHEHKFFDRIVEVQPMEPHIFSSFGQYWDCSIVARNIPPETTYEQLMIHFQKKRNGGGDVKCIVYPYDGPGTAMVCFDDSRVVSKAKECSHKLLQTVIRVQAMEPQIFTKVTVYLNRNLSQHPSVAEKLHDLKSICKVKSTNDPENGTIIITGMWNQIRKMYDILQSVHLEAQGDEHDHIKEAFEKTEPADDKDESSSHTIAETQQIDYSNTNRKNNSSITVELPTAQQGKDKIQQASFKTGPDLSAINDSKNLEDKKVEFKDRTKEERNNITKDGQHRKTSDNDSSLPQVKINKTREEADVGSTDRNIHGSTMVNDRLKTMSNSELKDRNSVCNETNKLYDEIKAEPDHIDIMKKLYFAELANIKQLYTDVHFDLIDGKIAFEASSKTHLCDIKDKVEAIYQAAVLDHKEEQLIKITPTSQYDNITQMLTELSGYGAIANLNVREKCIVLYGLKVKVDEIKEQIKKSMGMDSKKKKVPTATLR